MKRLLSMDLVQSLFLIVIPVAGDECNATENVALLLVNTTSLAPMNVVVADPAVILFGSDVTSHQIQGV